jgi:response regulator RpfG family c-di-GMP phosphodiesterase
MGHLLYKKQTPRKKISIIMADDERILLNMMKNKLEYQAYDVKTYEDKMKAILELAGREDRGEKTDLIISDIRSPGMNGLEFLAAAKTINPDTRFMLFTASELYVRDAKISGANAYVMKPISIHNLYACIDRALSNEEFFLHRRERNGIRR